VTREARALILTTVALLLLRLSLTGEHVLFVRSSMGPYLLVAGVVVALFSLCVMLEPAAEDHHHHGGHHLAWLLMVPCIVVFVIGPSPLGSFMATRQAQRVPDPGSGKEYRLPPAVDGAVDTTIADINQHGLYDPHQYMNRKRLRVDGFVASDADGPGGTFLLTRFVLSCCAADAYPVSIRVSGIENVPRHDTWLRIEGYWKAHDASKVPDVEELEADKWIVIPAPVDPYLAP
jgi:uncharacterized repeat protein (TIGR03943 family)